MHSTDVYMYILMKIMMLQILNCPPNINTMLRNVFFSKVNVTDYEPPSIISDVVNINFFNP